jgi:uncharacterized protein YhhL (DUF1145 family)
MSYSATKNWIIRVIALVLILLLGFTMYVMGSALSQNKPIPNEFANILRTLFGVTFVQDLEKGNALLFDQMNRFTETTQTEVDEDILKILDSDATYPTQFDYTTLSLLNPKIVGLFSSKHSFVEEELIHENREVLRKLGTIDEQILRSRPPADFKPIIIHPKLEGEGEWAAIPIGRHLFFQTKIRPDHHRPWAEVHLVRFDPKRTPVHMVMGNEHRDINGKRGEGRIPDEYRNNLIAAFNGGFLPAHDQGGMIVDYTLRKRMKYGKGTFIIYEDQTAFVGKYTREKEQELENSGKRIRYARQNLEPLLHNYRVNYRTAYWGITLKDHDPVYTKRSAIGITEDGFLIYGVGNNVSAQTLAYGMKMAGCVNAMHLDMNASNVTFSFYKKTGDGELIAERISSNCWYNLGDHYLGTYTHDFFYILKPY